MDRVTDFLLELRSEEIPARMQDKAREDIARLFVAELAKSGLAAAAIETFATPRRLVLIARDLPAGTSVVSEEVKGPKSSAPPQALEGFLRKTGLSREQLTERDGVFFAITERPGRATATVLAEAIPAIVRGFPWPKSMRWGAASVRPDAIRWVRPLQGIVALFGEDIVPVAIAGVTSGAATLGHRFHHPGPITIGSAADYVEKLRACHVIVDQDERRSLIRARATALAAEAGLVLVEDEGLVAENAGLTEWPVPLLSRFDPEFLSVPPEVIQLTARVNQKYFVCRDAAGALADAFICTANIEASDGGARIVEGNRKVLAARLSDARFFYDTDLKVSLEEQAGKLDKIIFHEKLGTVADKVDRVAKLARWLVEEGVIGSTPTRTRTHVASASAGATDVGLADLAERAARLAKADLVTGMVGEFPELQGLIGGYYAVAQGEDPRVAAAVRDHYKPVGQGDDVPNDPVTVAVALADKLDTIATFFAIDEKPTGSKDPFALRRAALGVIRLIQSNGLRIELTPVAALAAWRSPVGQPLRPEAQASHFVEQLTRFVKMGADMATDAFRQAIGQADASYERAVDGRFEHSRSVGSAVVEFFADRLKVQQREAGVRHDLIDAVFALGGEDDLVRLLARVHALQAFVGTEDGVNLLAGYKRAANILKKEGALSDVAPAKAGPSGDGAGQGADDAPAFAGATGSGYEPEPAEDALIAALDTAEPAAARAVAAEDFEGAMAALAGLRVPIDAFFENVTVNDADPVKRTARLALLARIRQAVHGVADFSRIV